MTSFASLCFLSYNRASFLRDAVESALNNADYPCEIIVHDDGSTDEGVYDTIAGLRHEGLVSTVILNTPGHNEGVGRSLNKAAALAKGDYILKLDQDLLFEPGWLRKTVELLDLDWEIGATGLFKYPVDPVDWRKMQIEWQGAFQPVEGPVPYHYVEDFVGSAICFTRETWYQHGPWPEHSDAFAEDVEWKFDRLKANGLRLALPDEDLATNRGFGVGPSTVVVDHGKVQTINHGPRVLS